MMGLLGAFKKWRQPVEPSAEALRMRQETENLAPRVERAVTEGRRLLEENNYTARIRALYQEGSA